MKPEQKDKPNFAAWQFDNLARIADELHDDNVQLRELMQDMRLAAKDFEATRMEMEALKMETVQLRESLAAARELLNEYRRGLK